MIQAVAENKGLVHPVYEPAHTKMSRLAQSLQSIGCKDLK